MKKNYIRLPVAFLLLLVPLFGWAQFISMPAAQSVNPCVGSVIRVSFTTSGTFAADNLFRVQLSPDGGLTYVDLPGSAASSPISTTLPARAIDGSSYSYRVVASSPQVVSTASTSFKFVTPPTAQLTGVSSGTNAVNAFSSVNLRITLSGGAPYTLTLQDSTKLTKNDDFSSQYDFPVTISKPATYSLLSVQNACGFGAVSGSAVVAVTKTGLLLKPRLSERFCLGATVPIDYVTTAPLPANTVFEAELINTKDNSTTPVSVSGTASPLQLTLPAQIPDLLTNNYLLRVFSRTAGISAYYNDPFGVYLYGPTQITMPETVSLTPGQPTANASLSYVGEQDINIVLSDGQAFWTSGPVFSDRGTVLFLVDPTVATSYSVVSATGACSAGVTFGNRVTRVILPPIRIDSLSTNSVCIGQPVTVYYTAAAGYKLPTRLTVRLKSIYQNDPGVVTVVVPTKPGQLTFTPPASMLPIADGSVQVRDAAVDTLVGVWARGLTVKSVPRLSFTNPQQAVKTPGEQFLEVNYYGGGVTRLQLTDGTVATLRNGYYNDNLNNVRVYVPQTTTFTTLSVTNECGTMPTIATTTVSLPAGTPQTPGLYISRVDLSKEYYCPGTQERLNIALGGTFAADNTFQIKIATTYNTASGTVIQTMTKAEPTSFTVPATSGSYYIWVSSTNPATNSNLLSFNISGNSPNVTVTVNPGSGVKSTTGSPLSITVVPPGEYVSLLYYRDGSGPSTYEFLDGTFFTNDIYLYRSLRPQVTTTYTVKRITNACGQSVTPVASPVTVVVQPLQVLTFNAGGQACVNAPVKVEFTQNGVIPSSLSYVVQVTVSGQDNWQTLPTSGTASPLTTTIPASLAGQQLSCRVAYITNGVLIPSKYTIGLKTSALPNVTLTGPNNVTTVEIDRTTNTRAELKLQDALVGGTAILSNGLMNQAVSTSTTSRSVFVSQPGTYTISSAYNACGYGQAQGVVRVTEKPYLTQSSVSKAVSCVGEAVSLSYAVGGSSDPGNKLTIYLVDAATQTKTLLTETTTLSGQYSLTLNPALRAGNYTVQYVTSAPVATLVGSAIAVRTPVRVVMAAGAKAIYATDVPTLPVSTTGATSPYTLTLVTPTSQTVVTGLFTNSIPLGGLQSGTYMLAGASNECGVGIATGSISLSVLPASSVIIRPVVVDSVYCTDRQYVVTLATTGSFDAANTFTAYLTDATGSQRALPTVGGPGQLTVTVPASLSVGDGYVLRVGSSSPAHIGASLAQNLSVRPSPTATLSGTTSVFRGDSTKISVALTGTAPWQFTIAGKAPRTYTADQSPFLVTVKPDTTTSFRLTDVRNNQCGVGTASGTALITVSPLLATEPALPLTIRTWPNPTAGVLYVEGELAGSGTLLLSLHNALGRLVEQQTVQPLGNQVSKQLDLSQLPAGVYILTAEQDGRRSQFKVLKQ